MKNRKNLFINYLAFTLAEVLITLGIIGAVAAVVMPSFIDNMTERRNSERHANIALKMTQAMDHMRATGTLVTYDSTESFVNELKKHLKIVKICDKDHLTDCWPTEKVLDKNGKEFDVSTAKIGRNLSLSTDTNNVGLILADGAQLILNYDNTTRGYDIGDRVEAKITHKDLPVGNGKTKRFPYTTNVTSAIDFVTDVNGRAKPNREKDTNNKYYDIRSFNIASFSDGSECGDAGCIRIIKYYSAVNCKNFSFDDPKYSFCGSGYGSSYGNVNDRWAGAGYECNKIGMALPNIDEFSNIRVHKSEYPSITDSIGDVWFWTNQESNGHATTHAVVMNFNGNMGNQTKDNYYPIVCLKK